MKPGWPLLLPLLSSWLFVAAALLLKRATEGGVGVWRASFVTNLVTALCFTPLLLLGGSGQPPSRLWQPAVVAVLLVAGQVLALLAFTRGDVSVATPVLGVKTVLVALLSTALLVQPVPGRLWLGAVLSAGAIALLQRGVARSRAQHGLTVATAAAAAALFAWFDVLVQKWSPAWGVGRFLPLMNALAALLSLGMIPLFRAPLRAIPHGVWPWLLAGAGAMALQSVGLITTVAAFGDATAVNIVYSSRGLWSVVLVWFAGRYLGNEEHALGRGVLTRRLAGAALMTAAVVTVLM